MNEFDKIIGYEDVKTELMKFASVLRNPEQYAKLGVTVPNGLLLSGVPGVGKTLMANSFIAESGCRAFVLRKDKPDGDFVNKIKETYENAKKEMAAVTIVFLDDMDKFANGDEFHPDAEEYVAVQACIDECKGHGVFTLATVNKKECLPESLLRPGRFDRTIDVRTPKGKESEKILRYFLGKKKLGQNVDIDELAMIMEGKSCAELESIVNEAGIDAGFAGKNEIEQADVINASLRSFFEAPENANPVVGEDRINVAIHEAGHAVVSEILEPDSVALISISHRIGDIGGITKCKSFNDYEYSKDSQEHIVMRMLGGKAATEIVTGVSDVGCNSDIEKAYGKVESLIAKYCSLGFENYWTRWSGEYRTNNMERVTAVEMERYFQMAKRIIAENRAFLDAVVEALVEKETLTYKEFQKIKQSCCHKF